MRPFIQLSSWRQSRYQQNSKVSRPLLCCCPARNSNNTKCCGKRSLQTAPRSAIEWLLAIDLVELSLEIQRYRLLRHKVLEAYRQKAIEATLRCIDMVGIAPDMEDLAEHYTLQNALSWRSDRIAAREIEARLAAYGFDEDVINVEVYSKHARCSSCSRA